MEGLLNFTPNISYTRDDFFINNCNSDIIQYIDNWPNWETKAFIIIGKKYSGKTHISHIWQEKCSAKFINTKNALMSQMERLSKDSCFILDQDLILNNEQNALHFYNLVLENKGWLMINASTVPQEWTFSIPDLGSRIRSCYSMMLLDYNEELYEAIIHKVFADFQIKVPYKIICFIMDRFDRSLIFINLFIKFLHTESLRKRKSLTYKFVVDCFNKFDLEFDSDNIIM